LSESKDIWEVARFANALAALSVQKIGTTVSMPTREEIEEFLSK
jgi:ribokinase